MLFLEIALWFEGCNHLMACQMFFLTIVLSYFFQHKFYGYFGDFIFFTPIPHSFPSPSHPLFTLAISPTKQKLKKNPPSFLPLQHLFIHLSGTGSHGVSQSIPFRPSSFACKRSLQWVIGLVQCLWLLIYHHHWAHQRLYGNLVSWPQPGVMLVSKSHTSAGAMLIWVTYAGIWSNDNIWVWTAPRGHDWVCGPALSEVYVNIWGPHYHKGP